MNIEKSISDSLDIIGLESPTKIQLETIPLIKQGYNVIGQSETGSGKTAAFGIPLVEKVVKGINTQALVLSPTRELSIQTAGELIKFSRFKKLKIQTIYGGVSMGPQIRGLKRAEVVVGTPGRILDHMRRGTLDVSNLRIFVLDEADRMIDMGFIDDIKTIEQDTPEDKQTLMFSATMPNSLIRMRDAIAKNAKKIKTQTTVQKNILRQFYCDVKHEMKFSLLVHLIKQENPKHAIIFCKTRIDADTVARNLGSNGMKALALHGGLSQQRREEVINKFHKGTTKILVATDVAGRGLDIKNVTHVFNYSIPENEEDYTNRIGRTARAGETGKAISLISKGDRYYFKKIIKLFSYDVEKIDVQDFQILPFTEYQQNDVDNFEDKRRFRKKSRSQNSRRPKYRHFN